MRRGAVLESLRCCEPRISKERRLLPKIGSLHAGQEEIYCIRVTRAVVAGKAIHRDAKKNAPNIRRDLISKV